MATLKTIGSSGQISLGKEYAGRFVSMEECEAGVWLLKLGEFIPDNERWLFKPEVESSLQEAVEWAEKNPPKSTSLTRLKKQAGG